MIAHNGFRLRETLAQFRRSTFGRQHEHRQVAGSAATVGGYRFEITGNPATIRGQLSFSGERLAANNPIASASVRALLDSVGILVDDPAPPKPTSTTGSVSGGAPSTAHGGITGRSACRFCREEK